MSKPPESMYEVLVLCNAELIGENKSLAAELAQARQRIAHLEGVLAQQYAQADVAGQFAEMHQRGEDDLRRRIAELESVCHVAEQAYCCVDEWWGSASTKQAARDSMWRLGRALRQNGFKVVDYDNLDWRGAILKELNDAGFYPSTNDPYHAVKPDFVYDPDAPDNKRIFGNAVGMTLKEIIARIAELEAGLGGLLTAIDRSTMGDLHHHTCPLWRMGNMPGDPPCTCGADNAVSQTRKLIAPVAGQEGER